MRSPLSLVQPFARGAAIACGWALMAISVATVAEIIGRKLFAFSFGGVDEVSGYLLAITSAVGFSWALVNRSHMRITLAFQYLPGWLCSVLNLLAMLSLSAMALFCAWRGYVELAANWASQKPANTPLQTPIWVPQSLWFFGLALFALVCAAAALHAVMLFLRDRQGLDRAYGPSTLEDEVRTEVSQLETRLGGANERP